MPMILNPYRFGAAASYGFAPSDLSGLVFWWRADVGVTSAPDGLGNDLVTAIADQSGNSNNGSWTGGKARVVASVTGSLPALQFNTSFPGLYLLPTTVFSGLTSAQVFMALKKDTNSPTADAQTGLFDFSRDTTNNQAIVYPYTNGTIFDEFGSTTRFNYANPGGLDSWHRLCIKAEASGYQAWKNNTSMHSNATSCGSRWNSASPQPRFGGAVDFATRTYRGYLLEIIFYNRVLSSTDRGTVDTYLADRISGTWYAAEHP